MLDRKAALDLLDWCEAAKLPDAIPYDEQEQLLLPLNALNAEFSIIGDGQKHYVQVGSQKKEIVAYPAMWSEYSRMLPRSGVAVSDKMLKYALPKVDAMIRGML